MSINYNDYPTLLFLSFDKDTAPPELPFECSREEVREFLSTCRGFQEMFAYIAVVNTLCKQNTTTNYLLNDSLFSRIDSDDSLREKCFKSFFSNNITAKHGAILFKNSGQYVYLLLGKEETKALKKVDGHYLCAALFRSNFFIGFEEAIITSHGLSVFPTGHYEAGMDRGGYLSFVAVTLGLAGNQINLPVYQSEKIKETIYIL